MTTVFLFTNLKNSTPLWEKNPGLKQTLLARYDALLQRPIKAHNGRTRLFATS